MGKKEKAITPAQIRKIHALANERGMDDDLLHAHIQVLTKKDSIKKLSLDEGIKVIDSLEGKQGESKGQKKASYKQIQFIYGLMRKLGWVTGSGEPDTDRLDRFLQSPKAGINIGSYKWLTRSKASKVIEALKCMIERQEQVQHEGCGEKAIADYKGVVYND